VDTLTPSVPIDAATPDGRPSGSDAPGVVGGPAWYRRRIRVFGPLLALIPPGIAGTLAYLALEMSDAAWSGAVGLVAGVLAAPVLLAVGAPFSNRELYPLAVAASLVIWVLVGFLAARRATRNPMASWADFWRHYAWMLGGIWVGAVAAMLIASQVVGESLVGQSLF
jgi:hypothetical protein